MASIRPPAVADTFYPAQPDVLAREVHDLLDSAAKADVIPKAIIAPHAGYIYSGPIAASVYARLAGARKQISRVVLMGPSHRVAFRGLAVSSADAFDTPLGRIAVDRQAIASLLEIPEVGALDAAHAQEHCIEVHLPFLQVLLDRFTLVPLVAGDAPAEVVAASLERVWGGPETLVVISSDLSHYLDYETARQLDHRTRLAIENLDPSTIAMDQACGRIPISGLLTIAKRRDLKVETVDLRNSGDTAGPRHQVVGYGGWTFTEGAKGATEADDADPAATEGLHQHKATLLGIARSAIEAQLKGGNRSPHVPTGLPPRLHAPGACFVTLKRQGTLRGCVGSPEAWRPLVADVADNAVRAAFQDPRFDPLGEEELYDLDISLSVLTRPQGMSFVDEADLLRQLRPRQDGLIIEDGPCRALFLPSVWEMLPQPHRFLGELKRKGGMASDHWSASLRAHRFRAVELKND